MIGRAISHYRVLSALGSGGMGVVYLAEDERLGRQVALKFLPQESLKNRQALDRFRVEARAASSLSHPGICAIYDIGEDDGMPFIVMEALRGENLRDRINKGPLKIGELVDVGIQLADALEAAHNQGIIHRDIKPSNIFVGDKNRVKILDFGLAKLSTAPGSGSGVDASTHQTVVKQLTMPGSALGTVSYMSPEQARGEDVDTRTDLFSLGAVLYEMATGAQAFGGSTHAVVFDAILNHTPPVLLNLNPLVPQRLEEIINTLLEKDRELRCQHASDLQAELKRLRRDLDSGTMMSAVGASRAGVSGASPARTSASRQPSAPAIPPPAPARSLWPPAGACDCDPTACDRRDDPRDTKTVADCARSYRARRSRCGCGGTGATDAPLASNARRGDSKSDGLAAWRDTATRRDPATGSGGSRCGDSVATGDDRAPARDTCTAAADRCADTGTRTHTNSTPGAGTNAFATRGRRAAGHTAAAGTTCARACGRNNAAAAAHSASASRIGYSAGVAR
jgi:serine/threonine protein kinase